MNIQGSLAFESINPSEIAHAANLFDTLKQYRIKLKNGSEAVLERAFELHVQSVLEKLDARLPGIEDTRQQKIEVIMAKHGLYDAAFQQVVLLCQSSKCHAPVLCASVCPVLLCDWGCVGWGGWLPRGGALGDEPNAQAPFCTPVNPHPHPSLVPPLPPHPSLESDLIPPVLPLPHPSHPL